MPQSSNIYHDTARDVITIRRQLAALLTKFDLVKQLMGYKELFTRKE